MKKLKGPSIVLLLTLLCGIFYISQAQDRDIFVYGTVVDEADNPVEGAWVILLYPPDSTLTGQDGTFSKLYTHEGMVGEKLKYTVKKDGYKYLYGSEVPSTDTLDLGKLIIQKIGALREITITGLVLDSATNEPIDSALIEIYPYNSINLPHDTSYSNSSGSFSGTLIVEEINEYPEFYYTCWKFGYHSMGRLTTADESDSFSVSTIIMPEVELITFPITGTVEDSLTYEPIENARVILMISNYTGSQQDTLFSDSQGNFYDSVIISSEYVSFGSKIFCIVLKEGYHDVIKRVYIPPDDYAIGPVRILECNNPADITITGTVRDSVSQTTIENATVILGYNINFDADNSLLVLRDTLISGNQGVISNEIVFDTASLENSEMTYVIKKDNYLVKQGAVKLAGTSLNLGEVLLHPSSTPVYQNPASVIPQTLKPNNVQVYSLKGQLLYEGSYKEVLHRFKIPKLNAQKVYIAVFRYKDVVLCSKKIIGIP